MNPVLDDPRGTFTGAVSDIQSPPPGRGTGFGGNLTLCLGVMIIPYRTPDKKVGAVTTGDVAQWLEHRYHIMEVYSKVHGKVIENALASSVVGAIEALVKGHRVDPFERGTSAIQKDFKRWISSGAAERDIPGAPTGAAKRGVSHRKAHPYAKSNPRRVSFRDTGTYMDSFQAWVQRSA